MSKEIQKPTRTRPEKKVKASPTPAVLTALALLSVSLRVTDGTLPQDLSATPNAGADVGELKLAAAHKTNATNNTSAINNTSDNKATAKSVRTKPIITHKTKVETLRAIPSNQHNSPSSGSGHK